MEPFDEERELSADRAALKRRSALTVLAILAVLALVVLARVLHLAGGAPTHGR
jgi:hypothetical protein